MNTKLLQRKLQKLKEDNYSIEKQINSLPEGKLCVTKNGKYNKMYLLKEGEKTYIPKSNKRMAESLAYKKYLEHKYKTNIQLIKLFQKYISVEEKHNRDMIKLLGSDYIYSKMLMNYFNYDTEKINYNNVNNALADNYCIEAAWKFGCWTNDDIYGNSEKNTYTDKLIHTTASGINVRSKSEVIIANALYEFGIPFVYEKELCIGSNIIHPDFACIHYNSGEIIYWEHFGMMDKLAYRSIMCEKIGLYMEGGLVPGRNLIMTYETKDYPLTYNLVCETIELYLQ